LNLIDARHPDIMIAMNGDSAGALSYDYHLTSTQDTGAIAIVAQRVDPSSFQDWGITVRTFFSGAMAGTSVRIGQFHSAELCLGSEDIVYDADVLSSTWAYVRGGLGYIEPGSDCHMPGTRASRWLVSPGREDMTWDFDLEATGSLPLPTVVTIDWSSGWYPNIGDRDYVPGRLYLIDLYNPMGPVMIDMRGSSSYMIFSPPRDSVYHMRILLVRPEGMSSSGPATFTDIGVFPNPATDLINWKDPTEVLLICNLLGSPVLSGHAPLDVRQLPAGLYVARSAFGSSFFVKR